MEARVPGSVVQEIPKCLDSEYPEVAWGKTGMKEKHSPFHIPRPKVTDFAVKVDMLYCGVCHSDCHMGLDDLNRTVYPFVGGHELIGKVVEIGSKVTKFKVGDAVGIGCFIDSCSDCPSCNAGDEQYCYKGMTGTYNGAKSHGKVGGNQDTKTFGGYTGSNVVHEDYIIKMPDGIDLSKAGPLLCAAITMYSPIVHWGAKAGGKTVGVIGVGGLGTMGIKIAKALGNKVVAISTTAKKEALAKEKGADEFVISSDPESIKAQAGTCDIILNTVAANHQLSTYMPLLQKQGTLVQLGLATELHQSIAGSLIGGIRETQEVVDLCAAKNIYPDTQMIEAKDIEWAWDQLVGDGKNPDGIRYVIDIKKSLENKDFLPPATE